VAAQTSQAA